MRTQSFVHLNVHTHYSINDGCASIRELVDAAIKERMPGMAITDNGNMFGIMEFFDYVRVCLACCQLSPECCRKFRDCYRESLSSRAEKGKL